MCFTSQLPPDSIWAAFGVGRHAFPMLAQAFLLGGHLAIRDHQDVLYLGCVQTKSGYLSNMNVGSRVPAYGSPRGWLLLSGLGPREIADMYRRESFAPLTEQRPLSIKALIERVEDAGRRGYVISRGTMEATGSSIAAPILNRRKEVVAAIDISSPDSGLNLDVMEKRHLLAVQTAARRISERIG